MLVALFLAVVLNACDSGDIEENAVMTSNRGKTVKLTARLFGVASISAYNYNVALAGFSSESEYAVAQRVVPATTQDDTRVEIVLDNLGSEVDYAELAITNHLRKRILTLEAMDLSTYDGYAPEDTIFMDLGDLQVDLFGCMQVGVFDKACINCHGANGSSAADLNLTAGNSLASLVDVPSSRLDGFTRVVSGDPQSSLLTVILSDGGENVLRYNHTEILSSTFRQNLSEVRQLIEEWISSLFPATNSGNNNFLIISGS